MTRTPQDPDVRDLLRRLAAREQAAMRELHAMMARRIVAFALQRSGDRDLAESVMIDTLMEIWNHPDRFRFEAQFSTWVLAIARNKLISAMRRGTEDHDDIADHEESLADPSPDAAALFEMREQSQALHDCVGKLPDAQRESLHLLYFEGLPLAEIAGLQNVPEGTVKTRLFHARRNVKTCVERTLRLRG